MALGRARPPDRAGLSAGADHDSPQPVSLWPPLEFTDAALNERSYNRSVLLEPRPAGEGRSMKGPAPTGSAGANRKVATAFRIYRSEPRRGRRLFMQEPVHRLRPL